MIDNDIDVSDINNVELPEGDGNGGGIITWLIAILASLGFGFWIGNKNKKKEVAAAYKKAYKDAANIFEKKYKLQHDAFVNKELDWKSHEEEYLQLIADYESYIDELESEEDSEENDGKISFFKAKLEELEELEESC